MRESPSYILLDLGLNPSRRTSGIAPVLIVLINDRAIH